METLMDNCSFLKKDIDATKLPGHLYAFKYLVKKSGQNVGTFTVCARGADLDEAKKRAREIIMGPDGDRADSSIRSRWGNKIEVAFTKWIELEK